MKRLIGFILFWIGIGMCIMLFMRHSLLAILIIIACLVLGYNLFTSCDWWYKNLYTKKEDVCTAVHCHRYDNSFYFAQSKCDYALSTFPERRHEVHTYIFFVPPFTFTRTDFKFDFQILLLLLWEWLTALPKCTPFPHTAHFAMKSTSFCSNFACPFYINKLYILHTTTRIF